LAVILAFVPASALSTLEDCWERVVELASSVPRRASTLEEELEMLLLDAWLAVIAAFVVVNAASILDEDDERLRDEV
jgi:hypothetical protein